MTWLNCDYIREREREYEYQGHHGFCLVVEEKPYNHPLYEINYYKRYLRNFITALYIIHKLKFNIKIKALLEKPIYPQGLQFGLKVKIYQVKIFGNVRNTKVFFYIKFNIKIKALLEKPI